VLTATSKAGRKESLPDTVVARHLTVAGVTKLHQMGMQN